MVYKTVFAIFATVSCLSAATLEAEDDANVLSGLFDKLLARREKAESKPKVVEEQLISQLNAFRTNFHTGDPEALFNQIYLPEACILPPGEPIVKGKANILSMLRHFMEYMKEIDMRSKKIDIFGDIAVQVFSYEEDGADGNILEVGKAMIVWKKDPVTKQWRILYNIWNTS